MARVLAVLGGFGAEAWAHAPFEVAAPGSTLFGPSVAGGDFDGDGFDDAVVRSQQTASGPAELVQVDVEWALPDETRRVAAERTDPVAAGR